MKPDTSGTLTTICMLIPLISVPYFAIQGTAGRPVTEPDPDEIVFGDADAVDSLGDADHNFVRTSDEAPPFPEGDPTRLTPPPEPDEDPFDSIAVGGMDDGFGIPDSRTQPDTTDTTEYPGRTNRGGLREGTVQGGTGRRSEPPEELLQAGLQRPAPAAAPQTASRQWDASIARLKRIGMRNYRVESLRDKSVFYVLAFFEEPTGVTTRFEGAGPDPLNALQSVVQQVGEWRSDHAQQ